MITQTSADLQMWNPNSNETAAVTSAVPKKTSS